MIGNQNQNRIFGLDLMRAAAILMVLFGHCVWIMPDDTSLFHQFLVLSGFFGVEVFFVLSGFLIGKILYELYMKEAFSLKTIFYFLKRRWFRTLPNYFLVLLINIGIATLIGYSADSLWKYFFFFQNLFTTMTPFFPESWSLSVEEYAYVLLPFFIWITGSFVKPKNKNKFFLFSVLTLILVFFTAKIYYQKTTANVNLNQWNISLKAVVIYRLDSIFIGVLCSWIYRNFTSFWQKNKYFLFVLGTLLFLFQFVAIGYLGMVIETHPFLWNVLYLPLISIAVSCFLPFLSEWKSTRSFVRKPVVFISLISYSMYLLHYSVILLLMKQYIIIDSQNTVELVGFLTSYILITIVLSYFLYRFYEKPMMNLRDKHS